MYKSLLALVSVLGFSQLISNAEIVVYRTVVTTSVHSNYGPAATLIGNYAGYPSFMKAYKNYFVLDLDGDRKSNCITYWQWEGVAVKAFSISGLQSTPFFNEIDPLNNKTYSHLSSWYALASGGVLRGIATPTVVKTGVSRTVARTLFGQSSKYFGENGATIETLGTAYSFTQKSVMKLDSTLTKSFNNQGFTVQQATDALQAMVQADGYLPD